MELNVYINIAYGDGVMKEWGQTFCSHVSLLLCRTYNHTSLKLKLDIFSR